MTTSAFLLLLALTLSAGACDAARPEGTLAPADAPGGEGQAPTPTARAGGADSSPISETEQIPMVDVHVFDATGNLVGPVRMPKILMSDEEWQARLTPEQYRITRNAGTERPFCGTLLDNKEEGVYACVCCGLPLFSSSHKFHSGSGWPSFFQPIAAANLSEVTDLSLGMVRTEINCTRCDAHLGHVFEDGPRPTGLRYCLNSESLVFTGQDELSSLADPAAAVGQEP